MQKFIVYSKYLSLISIALILMALCSIQGQVFPFFLSFASAMLCVGHRWYFVCPIVMIITLILSPTIMDISANLFCLLCMSLLGLIINKRGLIKTYLQVCVFILSQIVYIYFSIFILGQPLLCIIYLLASVLSFYIFRKFLNTLTSQTFLYRMGVGSQAAICYAIVILCGGLCSLQIPYINLYHLVCVFALFIMCDLCLKGHVILVSVLMGIGSVLCFADISYVALFVLLALTISFLHTKSGVYSVLGGIIVEAVLGIYFNVFNFFSYWMLLETLVAGIIYISIPKKYLNSLRVFFVNDNKEYGIRNVANRNRILIKSKLLELSNVFFEMEVVFKAMLKGALPIDEAKNMLKDEVISKVCVNCKEKIKCSQFTSKSIQGSIITLMNAGFEKGQVTLMDLPISLSKNCNKTNQIINVTNRLILQYKEYSNMLKNLDSSRLLIAEQLYGVARIMRKLSIMFDEKMQENKTLEQNIIKSLELIDVACSEALVFSQNEKISSVALLVKSDRDYESDIIEVVSQQVGMSLKIVQNIPSETSGWQSIILEGKNQFSIIYGIACECKTGNNVSGDCYSVQSIADNKYIIAISDGMGHGDKARKNSELTISIIENFYKAGFDNEIVLSSVNKLMNINQMEDFATLDLCIVDLNNAFADFIKLGAAETFIRHEMTTSVVHGKSLPLGIVDEIKTSVQKTALQSGDTIILCSDGVEDAFFGFQNLYNFINHLEIGTPQEMADCILQKAKQISRDVLKDDVSVVVARIFQTDI